MTVTLPSVPLLDIVFRLSLALAFGAALGIERERRHKPAGLRTHMLVTLGAAMFALLGSEVVAAFSPEFSRARLDPIRVLEGIITGIGFLGAGSIIQNRSGVEGLTTAAGIWVAGGIGAACGLGMIVVAAVAALFALLTLGALGWLERRAGGGGGEKGPLDSPGEANLPG
jgi:putative Mg2+ transporter-C (MgtC) family protein